MRMFKKAAAALTAAAMLAGVGCTTIGSDTATAMTIDGVEIQAGVYIYYAYAAYSQLTTTIRQEDSEVDVQDKEVVRAQTMDNKNAEQWVIDKAEDYCREYAASEIKFKELGLELDEQDQTEIDEYLTSFWEQNEEAYKRNGISEDAIRKILTNSYMQNELFLYYYDIGGQEGVTEDDLKKYYEDCYRRARYINFSMTDGNGEALTGSDLTERKAMIEDYVGRVEKQKSPEKMEEEMAAVESEYNAYMTSISEEAAAATATSATDEEGNEIPATTTTTAQTTVTTTTAAAEDEAESTTVAGGEEEAQTTAADEGSAAETTTAADDSSADAEGETTTTTTDLKAGEKIISSVTTDEHTNEEDITYTPSKNAYFYLFNDAQIGVPELVDDMEEDNSMYMMLRLDLKERMTEDDLWTDQLKETLVAQAYADSFNDILTKWKEAQNVQRNERAVKRYDAFKIDIDDSSANA